jgi:hypothetical protein
VADDPLALLLKFGFLAVLYLFLFVVARSAVRDVAGTVEGGYLEPDGAEPSRPRGRRRRKGGEEGDRRPSGHPRLEVVAALGHEPGTAFEVGDGLTLGRASTAGIIVEDPYASSTHARVYPRGEHVYVEDAGSTNGTYLNGRPLRRPQRLNAADTVRIGETEYRYQE